ncbi:MAG TPA: hypothetical protein VGL91_10735 [Acidobacteriota bacterium]
MPILRILIAFIISFSFWSQAAAAQQKAAPIGMVLQVKGDVQIQRSGAKKRANLGDLLYPSDHVMTGLGEAMFVFCPSNERVMLKNHTTLDVTAQSIRVVKGAPPTRQKASACVLPRVALGSESMERVGALRARGYPPILLYVGGPITTSHPLFHWGPIPDAKIFHLTLRDENGSAIWEHETSSTSVAYPESAPALAEKSYQWEVRAEKDGKIVAQQAASFDVKPNRELSRASAGDAAERLLLATELENAGYYAEAADFFRQLSEAHPDDTRLTRHLSWLYWKAGLVTAMNQELDKLKSKEDK